MQNNLNTAFFVFKQSHLPWLEKDIQLSIMKYVMDQFTAKQFQFPKKKIKGGRREINRKVQEIIDEVYAEGSGVNIPIPRKLRKMLKKERKKKNYFLKINKKIFF